MRKSPAGALVEPPEGGWFDGATIGSCVVRKSSNGGWQMWYSGRPEKFSKEVMPIATGFVGVATSEDGLTWQRIAGAEAHGSCLAPNADDAKSFDASHVAVGCVVSDGDDLTMYYFGGGNSAPKLGERPLPVGAAMCIGTATCRGDEGFKWQRATGDNAAAALLEPSAELGQLFVGWPQLVRASSRRKASAPEDLLFYHAATSDGRFAIGLASRPAALAHSARDNGGNGGDDSPGGECGDSSGSSSSCWEQRGYVLSGRDDDNAFDAGGVSARVYSLCIGIHTLEWLLASVACCCLRAAVCNLLRATLYARAAVCSGSNPGLQPCASCACCP